MAGKEQNQQMHQPRQTGSKCQIQRVAGHGNGHRSTTSEFLHPTFKSSALHISLPAAANTSTHAPTTTLPHGTTSQLSLLRTPDCSLPSLPHWGKSKDDGKDTCNEKKTEIQSAGLLNVNHLLDNRWQTRKKITKIIIIQTESS